MSDQKEIGNVGSEESLAEIVRMEACAFSKTIRPDAIRALQNFFARMKTLRKNEGSFGAAFLLQQLFELPSEPSEILKTSGSAIYTIWKSGIDLDLRVARIMKIIRDINVQLLSAVRSPVVGTTRARTVECVTETSYSGYDDEED